MRNELFGLSCLIAGCVAPGPEVSGEASAIVGTDTFVASPTASSAPQLAAYTVPFETTLTETPLHDYLGVIGGPAENYQPTHTSSCSSVVQTAALQRIGVTSVRNNDYGDDSLDMDLLFNCTGSPFRACSDGTYPCWSGERCLRADSPGFRYDTDCGMLLFDQGSAASGAMTSDERFRTILDAGFEPFFRLGSSGSGTHHVPILHAGTQVTPSLGPSTEAEQSNWIAAAQCVVDHYDAMSALPGRAHIRYLDLLTEYSYTFWRSYSVESFARFWGTAYRSLKNRFSNRYKIGGPGFILDDTQTLAEHLDETTCDTSSSDLYRFLVALYRHSGGAVAPDWLGVHVFTNEPANYTRWLRAVRRMLDGHGRCFGQAPWAGTRFFADVEVVVDAYAPESGREEDCALPANQGAAVCRYHTDQEGGALTAASFIAMQERGVTRAFAYRANGRLSGVVTCDGANAEPVPRGNVLALWSALRRRAVGQRTIHAPLSSNPDLYFMDAVAADGQRYVLASNTGSLTRTYRPEFGAGQHITDFATRCVTTVNDSSRGWATTRACGMSSDTVTIAPYTVQLIELGSAPASVAPVRS